MGKVLTGMLAAVTLSFSTAALAQAPHDAAPQGLEALASPSAPPALPEAGRTLCLADDNFDGTGANPGTWLLTVGRGTVGGTASYAMYAPGCYYSVVGSFNRTNFSMDLIQTGTGCCESGIATGSIDVPGRVLAGQIAWSCGGQVTVGQTTWHLCPR